jgi:hypothetical protein
MARTAPDLTITPIHPDFGVRVDGVDLEETLDEATFHVPGVRVPASVAPHDRGRRRPDRRAAPGHAACPSGTASSPALK